MRRALLALALLVSGGMLASPQAQQTTGTKVAWEWDSATFFKICIDNIQPCREVAANVREAVLAPISDGAHTITIQACNEGGCSTTESVNVTCAADSCTGPSGGSTTIPLPGPVSNIRFTGSSGGGQNPMAITRVTATGTPWGRDYSGAGGTTIATGTFSFSAGDDMVVTIRSYDPSDNATISNCSDLAGNTFSVGPTFRHSSSFERMTICYVLGAANGHANNVVTATFANSTQYRSIIVNKYNGLAGGSLDVGSGSPAAATGTSVSPNLTVTSSSFNTAVAEELVHASFTVADTFPTWSLPGAYTQAVEDDFRTTSTADRITSSTLTGETVAVTASDRTAAKTIIVVSFKPATGGGGAIAALAGFAYRQHRR